MNKKTKRSMGFKTFTMVLFVLLGWNSMLPSQDFSHGNLEFIFSPENNWTQFAIWMEDESGGYVGTVYITDFIGRRGGGNRTGDPDIDTQSGNRLSALPGWAHRRGVIDTTFGIENDYPPDETQPAYPSDMDAVSGATPSQNVQSKIWQLHGLAYGNYACWIEVNQSFDFNEYHNYSWYRGQPSVVWKVPVVVSNTADSSTVLDYLGYGSVDGSNGEIHPPDSTITTASELLRNMGDYKFKVVYSPGIVGVEDNSGGSRWIRFFFLDQNYPNPFNPATTIRYVLPQWTYVLLKVYDVQGREVATLVDENRNAGSHAAFWNASGFASGVYFYRIQAGKYSEIKKLVLVR